jgi:hypothetical protein
LPVASSLYPASAHSDSAFNGLAKAAMAFLQHCAGVLARIALTSLPASSCPCCRRCASVVAKLAFEGPAGGALAFAGIALAFCPHSAGVITSFVLLSLCRHCAPALQTVICPVTKQLQHLLASLPALRHCRCRHSAGIVALITLASMLLLHWRCRLQHTPIAASITN